MARPRKPETPDPFREAVWRYLDAYEKFRDDLNSDPNCHQICTRVARDNFKGQHAFLCEQAGYPTKYASEEDILRED